MQTRRKQFRCGERIRLRFAVTLATPPFLKVAIIQDEVTEKQEKIHELEVHAVHTEDLQKNGFITCGKSQALLREARLKVDSVDEKAHGSKGPIVSGRMGQMHFPCGVPIRSHLDMPTQQRPLDWDETCRALHPNFKGSHGWKLRTKLVFVCFLSLMNLTLRLKD